MSNYTGISLTADSGILAAVRADELVNIWVAPSGDTSRAKQITSGAGRGDGRSGPAWTADDKIVYESFTGRDIHLWTMAADGTGNKQLTLTTRLNQGPALSPDGRSLVWVSHSDIGIAHIWRMELDGSNQKQLTNGAGEYYPQFSPDGNWIVYGEAGTDSMPGWLSLWKMPIDGGTPVRLTDKQSWVPVISLDGKLIACNYFDEATSGYKISVIPFEGGPPIKIFGPLGSFIRPIRWTPDGRAVAYIVNRGGVSNVWSQPLDGSPPRQLTDFKDQLLFNFAWSRDGKQLALSRGVVNSDVVLISGFE